MKPTFQFRDFIAKSVNGFIWPGLEEIWRDSATDARLTRQQCPSGLCTPTVRCQSCPCDTERIT